MKDDDETLWVCGGVSWQGEVRGHASRITDDDELRVHNDEEKALGTTWRWCCIDRMFMSPFIPQPRKMTADDFEAVANWLIKNGYAEISEFDLTGSPNE